MKPNQVQLWRIINGAHRSFIEFDSFPAHGPQAQTVQWRQIAQDGVQFAFRNYERIGAVNAKFNMATANRVDLLIKAPAFEADYALQVVTSVSDVPAGTPITLLTVRVKGDGVQEPRPVSGGVVVRPENLIEHSRAKRVRVETDCGRAVGRVDVDLPLNRHRSLLP